MWPLKMMMEISYYRHEKTAVVSCSVENKLPNNMHSIIHFFLKEVIYISIYLRIGIGSARRNSAKQWFYLDHKVIFGYFSIILFSDFGIGRGLDLVPSLPSASHGQSLSTCMLIQ